LNFIDILKSIGDHYDGCLTIIDMCDKSYPCIYVNDQFTQKEAMEK